jgi:hypothetical protein
MASNGFKPGQSGNPKGRPPKQKTKTTQLRELIAEAVPEIIEALISEAKKGNVAAASALLDRVCPRLKNQALPVHLELTGSLAEKTGEIVRAMTAGEISPETGAQLINGLTVQQIMTEDEKFKKSFPVLNF